MRTGGEVIRDMARRYITREVAYPDPHSLEDHLIKFGKLCARQVRLEERQVRLIESTERHRGRA